MPDVTATATPTRPGAEDAGWALATAHLARIQKAACDLYGIEGFEQNPLEHPKVVAHLMKVFRSMRPEADEAMLQQMLEQERVRSAKVRAQCPTAYENPEWYALLVGFYDSLAVSAAEMNLKITHKPLLGTLATGRVNGMAVGLDDTPTRIILLEHGLFGFANLMCKAVASAFPMLPDAGDGRLGFSTDTAEVARKLDADDAPVERFFDALCSYVVRGNPHAAEAYAAPPRVDRLVSTLRASMEMFIVGHEIGHVALGHLDGRRAPEAITADLEAQTVRTNWQQEFEADAIGLLLMVRTMIREHGLDVAMSYWGAHLFFGCVEIVERTVSLLATGEPATWRGSSHPPTQQRQAMLQQVLERHVDAEDAVRGAVSLAGVLDEVLAQFWARCEGPLRRLHAQGHRPAAWWMAGAEHDAHDAHDDTTGPAAGAAPGV